MSKYQVIEVMKSDRGFGLEVFSQSDIVFSSNNLNIVLDYCKGYNKIIVDNPKEHKPYHVVEIIEVDNNDDYLETIHRCLVEDFRNEKK